MASAAQSLFSWDPTSDPSAELTHPLTLPHIILSCDWGVVHRKEMNRNDDIWDQHLQLMFVTISVVSEKYNLPRVNYLNL